MLSQISLALLAASLALSVPCAFAQTTLDVPGSFSSIQSAINAAQNGDIVQVSPGIYRENIDFKGKHITVTSSAKSYADATSTVLQGDSQNPVVTFHTGESNGATLNGFTVQNGCAPVVSRCAGINIDGASPTITNNLVTGNENAAIFIGNGASPTLEGNDIKGNSGHGLLIVTAGEVIVRDNLIEENLVPLREAPENDGAGIKLFTPNTLTYVPAHSLLLDHNVVRNNVANGSPAFEQQAESAIPKLILINNTFYGNLSRSPGGAQIYIWGSGTSSDSRTALTEINNTVVGGGQFLVGQYAPSTIANNVFYNTTPLTKPYIDPQYAGLTCDYQPWTLLIDIHNNDIFNVGGLIDSGCKLGAGSLSVEPQLQNITTGDLHVQPSSPLVAAGDITVPLIPAADLDNKARTVCGKIDIGAYELRPHPPTTLTSSANPTPGGGSVTFTARLTGNCNVPTGTVTFLDGGLVIGTAVLDSQGVAGFSTSFLVVGQHNVTATYTGDFNFDDSTSPVLVQIITGDPTVTSLSVVRNPAAAFSSIALSSFVSSQYGTPTGSVVFRTGNQVLATAALDETGRAAATISTLGAGTYPITVSYTADTRFQSSTSSSVQEVVVEADSLTSLSASPNPASVGQPVTFNVSVRATQGNNVPTGTVSFMDADTKLGTATLNNGGATFTISALALGAHPVTVRYAGSSDFNSSSASLTEVINAIGTEIGLTSSPNPANGGQTVKLTATVIALLTGVTPGGTVTFRDGMIVLGTATLDASGAASFTTSSLAVGTHPLQAVYAGNGSFGPITSAVINELIRRYALWVSASTRTGVLPPNSPHRWR